MNHESRSSVERATTGTTHHVNVQLKHLPAVWFCSQASVLQWSLSQHTEHSGVDVLSETIKRFPMIVPGLTDAGVFLVQCLQ